MKVGIFSGSFDPIHTGHAMVANYAAQWLDLAEVWIMVSRLNPFKSNSLPESDTHRINMAELAVKDTPKVKASDFELGLPLPSYTYLTLSRLRERYPDNEFVLIIGSDNWNNFSKWRNSDDIIREFPIYIYPRPGYPLVKETLPENVKLMENVPLASISSSFIRESVKEGKNLNHFLPEGVFDYILKNSLYKK